MREPAGFREFVEGRSPALLRTAWMLTGDAATAEDLLQTALARTWPHWSRVSLGHPEAYVRTVMVRTNASWRARFWTREQPTDLTTEGVGIPTARYADTDPSGAVTNRVLLAEALARLPLRQRQAVVLRYFEVLAIDRRLLLAAGGAVAVAALALPLGAELLPESAVVGPGAGAGQSTTAPVSDDAGPLQGGTRVTHLSEPITFTATGTATVELGARPEGATGVGLVLDCLSAGEFTYPDGGGLICDAGADPTDQEDFGSLAYVVDLDEGADEVEIRASEGATWRLTAAYVSTEVTAWGVNAKGQTFGVENVDGSPDLLAVVATNGQPGYAYVSELDAAGGPPPTSPEDALVQQQERLGETFSVAVYESDGETVIGEFVIGGSGPTDAEDDATVTWIP